TVVTNETTTYYLRSSVLGGAVIAEIDQTGAKKAGYIFANGERVAVQSISPVGSSLKWVHFPQGTGSWIETSANSFAPGSGERFGFRQEMDPLGAEVGVVDPIDLPYPDLKGNEPLYIDGGDPFDYSGGCTLDGVPVSCSFAAQTALSGASVGFSGSTP